MPRFNTVVGTTRKVSRYVGKRKEFELDTLDKYFPRKENGLAESDHIFTWEVCKWIGFDLSGDKVKLTALYKNRFKMKSAAKLKATVKSEPAFNSGHLVHALLVAIRVHLNDSTLKSSELERHEDALRLMSFIADDLVRFTVESIDSILEELLNSDVSAQPLSHVYAECRARKAATLIVNIDQHSPPG